MPLNAHANPRVCAARSLKRVLINQQPLSVCFVTDTAALSENDLRLYKALCFGVTRYYFQLAYAVDRQLSKPLKKKDYDIYALLLLGLFQRAFMRTPDYAAVNSAVDATRKLNKPWAQALVNAVLRRCSLPLISDASPQVQYNHPAWLINQLMCDWPDHAQTILQENNQEPPLCIRINTKKTTVADYQALLLEQGIAAVQGTHAATALYLSMPQNKRITALPNFDDGWFSVQDEASQRCVQWLDLQPGHRVLDACAAPGGKTMHMLESTDDLMVTAVDRHGERLTRLQENAQRLGLSPTVLTGDACKPQKWFDGMLFDRILCDAPCSATGVIRRHPDIKCLLQAKAVDALVLTQQQMLKALWPCLKPGGILLYTTCSLLRKENQQQIAHFLQYQQDATCMPLTDDATYGLQVFPSQHGSDGFFYAALHKRDH